jgi:hypothetical protein
LDFGFLSIINLPPLALYMHAQILDVYGSKKCAWILLHKAVEGAFVSIPLAANKLLW